ncbi:MAG: hypothetical protein F6J90_13785 [Moorea sp. SIOASIH]|uniref:hypothetical protein n=1 Tax=Moorena sp. SIOASIH TaxID=2607817 RepID=UPI0013BB8F33|nr:hypothetical protein [Moorena sp. SIOASIH]NEO37336.1 hypothetical protein [Moorena sp. SIOASIH]
MRYTGFCPYSEIPYSLFSLPCSLFPVPCSLKSHNCVPCPIENRYTPDSRLPTPDSHKPQGLGTSPN